MPLWQALIERFQDAQRNMAKNPVRFHAVSDVLIPLGKRIARNEMRPFERAVNAKIAKAKGLPPF